MHTPQAMHLFFPLTIGFLPWSSAFLFSDSGASSVIELGNGCQVEGTDDVTFVKCPVCALKVQRGGEASLDIEPTATPDERSQCEKFLQRTSHKGASNRDDCQIKRTERGIVIQCPACQISLDESGQLKHSEGPDCNSFSGFPGAKRPSDDASCQKMHSPDGHTIVQCPSCQKITDKYGKTIVEQGSDCDKYATDLKRLFVQNAQPYD